MRSQGVFLAFCLGLAFAGASWAEERGPELVEGPRLEVEAFVRPTKVHVGDEIRLFIRTQRPWGFSVRAPSLKEELSPFEVKKLEVLPPSEKGAGVRQSFILTLTVFELGDQAIPSFPILFQDRSGRFFKARTPPISVKVAPVPRRVSDKDDIRTIKDPESLSLVWLRQLVLWILTIFLTIFLAVKMILRRAKEKVDPESLKSPHERVFLELERLTKKGPPAQQKTKEFYSDLADILRRYLERGFHLEALERTTVEIIGDLNTREFDPAVLEKIKHLFQNSDLVKFAKYSPPRSLADELARELAQIVERTKPLPQEEVKSP